MKKVGRLRHVGLACLFALIVAKVTLVLLRGPVPMQNDSAQYWQLSTLVLGGDAWLFDAPIAYRTPVYPWFLALVRWLFGPDAIPAIVGLQGALLVASIWMATRLAVAITGLPSAATVTALLSVPGVAAITFAATTLSETLFVFLLMSHVGCVVGYSRRGGWAWSIAIGVTFALTLLTRPIVLLLWIPSGLFLLVAPIRESSRSLKSRLLVGLASALVALAMVSPWLARNAAMFGKPFVTEFVGRNLWIVTFQDGSGAGLAFPDTQANQRLHRRLDRVGVDPSDRLSTWAVSSGLVASGLSDASADQAMKQVAMDAINLDRNRFSKRAVRRIINFWRTRATAVPDPIDDGTFFGQRAWRFDLPLVDSVIARRASNLLMANTAILGVLVVSILVLVWNRPSRGGGLYLAAVLVYFTVVTGVFEIPAYRYRMVVEPIAAAVVGAAVAVVASKRIRPAKAVL